MNYFKTAENFPIKTNSPQSDWTPILERKDKESDIDYLNRCEIEYKRICDQLNAKHAADHKKLDDEAKPKQEREKLIRDRMYKIAEQELIDEGIILEA